MTLYNVVTSTDSKELEYETQHNKLHTVLELHNREYSCIIIIITVQKIHINVVELDIIKCDGES